MGLILTMKEHEKVVIKCACGNELRITTFAREGYKFPSGSIRMDFTGDMKVIREKTDEPRQDVQAKV